MLATGNARLCLKEKQLMCYLGTQYIWNNMICMTVSVKKDFYFMIVVLKLPILSVTCLYNYCWSMVLCTVNLQMSSHEILTLPHYCLFICYNSIYMPVCDDKRETTTCFVKNNSPVVWSCDLNKNGKFHTHNFFFK